jgi:hypothetical protein
VSDSQSASRQAPALPAPETCPRFHTCSAAICPLSLDEGIHLKDEAVCFYLRQSGKAGAGAYFAGKPDEEPTYRACKLALPVVTAKYPDIARHVQRASRTPIKGSRPSGFLGKPGVEPVPGVGMTGEEPPR